MSISMEVPVAGWEITTTEDPTKETVSLTIFIQGCTRRCDGCLNPELQSFDKSLNIPLENIQKLIDTASKAVCGSVCFCGGDWLPTFKNALEVLIDFCREKKIRTILYTGEYYEDIPEILKEKIDIIVSDPFDITKLQEGFPASSNQRVWIDGERVDPKTLKINQK